MASVTVTKRNTAPLTRGVTYLRTKAVEKDGEWWLHAWASTPSEDRHGDVVNPLGAQFTLPIVLLWQHDTGTPIGSIPEATKSASGIRVRAKLNKAVPKAAEAWALAQDGVLSFSIGFLPIKETALPDGGYRYDAFEITEISVVSVPANADARISVGKSVAYIDERHAQKARTEPERLPAYIPCGDVVEDFKRAVASLPEAQRKRASDLRSMRTGRVWTLRDANGDEIATVAPQSKQAEPAAKPAKAPSSNLEKRLARLEKHALPFGGPEKFAELLGDLIGKSIKPYREKIAALEKQNETMLAEIERRTWSYKGYWTEGEAYRMNDVTTDGGSTWLALCDTKERPNFSSNSWRVIAKKGRDA